MISALLLGLSMLLRMELKWITTFISLGLLFGFLSPVIAARRLYYLSAAAPHASLLSITLSIIVTESIGFNNYYLASTLVAILMMLGVNYLVRSGLDPDVATSAFVAGSATSSVLLLHYVLVNYRPVYSINALMLGDPLLVSFQEVLILVVILIVTIAVVLTTFRENICVGIDADLVRLSGVKAIFYDLTPYVLIAINAIVLVKLVGYVLSHVMILLPSLASMNLSKQARETLIHSVGLSAVTALAGLLLSTYLNVSPSGAIGGTLTLIYLATLVKRRCFV
ncbi:MAG: metal ABC transporter permease [Zestosphaera sp.]